MPFPPSNNIALTHDSMCLISKIMQLLVAHCQCYQKIQYDINIISVQMKNLVLFRLEISFVPGAHVSATCNQALSSLCSFLIENFPAFGIFLVPIMHNIWVTAFSCVYIVQSVVYQLENVALALVILCGILGV
jgi:hypothetical protein